MDKDIDLSFGGEAQNARDISLSNPDPIATPPPVTRRRIIIVE